MAFVSVFRCLARPRSPFLSLCKEPMRFSSFTRASPLLNSHIKRLETFGFVATFASVVAFNKVLEPKPPTLQLATAASWSSRLPPSQLPSENIPLPPLMRPSPSPPLNNSNEYDPEFHVNEGRSIETIVKDTETFFQGDTNLSVYTPNIHFKETVFYEFHLNGIRSYGRMLRWLRFMLRLYFAETQLTVTKVYRRSSHVVCVNWTFSGIPRTSMVLGSTSKPVIYEGYSVYHLSKKGYVETHIVENIIPTPHQIAYMKNIQAFLNTDSPIHCMVHVPKGNQPQP